MDLPCAACMPLRFRRLRNPILNLLRALHRDNYHFLTGYLKFQYHPANPSARGSVYVHLVDFFISFAHSSRPIGCRLQTIAAVARSSHAASLAASLDRTKSPSLSNAIALIADVDIAHSRGGKHGRSLPAPFLRPHTIRALTGNPTRRSSTRIRMVIVWAPCLLGQARSFAARRQALWLAEPALFAFLCPRRMHALLRLHATVRNTLSGVV